MWLKGLCVVADISEVVLGPTSLLGINPVYLRASKTEANTDTVTTGRIYTMRLVNKKTLKMEWFPDHQFPPYIVLSHCWSGREPTLQEYNFQCYLQKDAQSAGTAKIVAFCEDIADRGEDYAWVDTCCIDKTSSSELQEVINSIWKWYHEANLCMVFMKDVKARIIER